MSLQVRLLPLESASGAGNMARDEVMLHTAAIHGIASLRFYTWDEPTLSLGYFQPFAEGEMAKIAVVRRATGGAAIVHDPRCEITYSLALPAGKEWETLADTWICQMHYIIRDALAELGVQSHAVVCGEEKKDGPVLCFLHHTPGDLRIGASKIAGSAQRKNRGAILQHGSILLERSPFAPQLLGIRELSSQIVNPVQLITRTLKRFASETGWSLHASDWRDDERGELLKAATAKYESDEWTRKR